MAVQKYPGSLNFAVHLTGAPKITSSFLNSTHYELQYTVHGFFCSIRKAISDINRLEKGDLMKTLFIALVTIFSMSATALDLSFNADTVKEKLNAQNVTDADQADLYGKVSAECESILEFKASKAYYVTIGDIEYVYVTPSGIDELVLCEVVSE